jgi:hypothetical protein
LTLDLLTDPDKTVVVFESDAGMNAAGGPELLPGIPRHLGGDMWGFADGHAVWLARKSQGVGPRGDPIWLKETESPVRWQP